MSEMVIDVEFISRETIKPSSPTPGHLKTFQISLLDQLAPSVYTSACLFYPPGDGGDDDDGCRCFSLDNVSEKSLWLKRSLCKSLTSFYPLAGRFKGHASIDCNDEGAEFIVARVANCRVSDIFSGQPKTELMSNFVPADIHSREALTGCLILVQLSFFECGGMAIGISMSHKIADGACLGLFITSWVANTIDLDFAVAPVFNASSVFPPADYSTALPAVNRVISKCRTRRCVFDR